MIQRLRLSILFALVLCISACKKEKNIAESVREANNDTMACIFPSSVKLPKLKPAYRDEKAAMVERFANKLWNKNDNVSFLVAKDGQIIYERYIGFAKNKKDSIASDTPLHIASVSKMLTAAAIMQLVNRGKFELDQQVNTILTTFPYPDVTIRMLLNHRSGLRNYAYFTAEKNVWDTKKTITNEDVLRLLGEKKIALATPAGTRFAYCNTNYAMLALVIERITGLKYPEAMNRMIFKPLGMKDTFVFNLERDRDSVSQTFKGNGVRLAYDFLDAVYGDKNIYSTPRDLLKFDMATYDPEFLDKKLYDQVYKGYSYESKGTKNYGLGIRMVEWETGQKFYFHNGWWHGNTSAYVTLRKEKVTIIALSNKMTKKTYLVRKLAPGFGDYPFKLDPKDQSLE